MYFAKLRKRQVVKWLGATQDLRCRMWAKMREPLKALRWPLEGHDFLQNEDIKYPEKSFSDHQKG